MKQTKAQHCNSVISVFTFDWRKKERKSSSKVSLFSWTNVAGLSSNKMMSNLRRVQTIPIRLISPLIRKRFLCTANKSTNEQHHERTASFGFLTVPENEKAEKGSLICIVRPLRFCYLKLSMRLCIHFTDYLFCFYFIWLWFELKFTSFWRMHTHSHACSA